MDISGYRWRCSCCGEERVGLPFDLVFRPPPENLSAEAREAAKVELGADFCRVEFPDGRVDRFIRCLLPFPVPEVGEEFMFGVWMSVAQESWDVYGAGFDSGDYAEEGCFGYLMHEIPGYPGSRLLHCNVTFQRDRRPIVELHDCGHALVEAQRHGVALGQVERWVAGTLPH